MRGKFSLEHCRMSVGLASLKALPLPCAEPTSVAISAQHSTASTGAGHLPCLMPAPRLAQLETYHNCGAMTRVH